MASPTLALTDLALRASEATDDVLRWEDLGLVEGISIGPFTLRFYALRLHEAGMIKSTPNKLIAEGTDWRFLNELKRELKA